MLMSFVKSVLRRLSWVSTSLKVIFGINSKSTSKRRLKMKCKCKKGKVRSSVTGRYVSKSHAKKNPRETVTEKK